MAPYRSSPSPTSRSQLELLEDDMAALAARGMASPLFGNAVLAADVAGLAGAAIGEPGGLTRCDSVGLTTFRCGDADALLAVVAAGNYKDDGCGVASAAAVRAFVAALAAPLLASVDVPVALRRAMISAHDSIVELVDAPLGGRTLETCHGRRRDLRGIGASVVAAAVLRDRVFVAHVGQTSAHLVRGGAVRKLVMEDTLANDARYRAELDARGVDASMHAEVVLRLLGFADEGLCPKFSVSRAELEAGDRVVLANGPLDGEAWARALASAPRAAREGARAIADAMPTLRRWAPATVAVVDVV